MFSVPFFFCSSSETSITQTLVSLILSQISSHSFSFIFLFSSCFCHSIFQLTYLFFCLSYSTISSFQTIFNFSNVLFIYLHYLFFIYLFFVSSMSLVIALIVLIVSCIFYILFLRLWNFFTVIILNYFSGSFLISSLFIWSCEFLPCFFICPIFLCLSFFFSNLLHLKSPFPRPQGYIPSSFGFCSRWERLFQWFVLISCQG